VLNNATTSNPEPKYEGMNISGLVGGPLVAIANANALMAKEQSNFLLKYCFDKRNDCYEPVMITMLISRMEPVPTEKKGDAVTYEEVVSYFKLPLLTIVPFNSLAIEKFELKFDMQVTSYQGKDNLPKNSVTRSGAAGDGESSENVSDYKNDQPLQLFGSLSGDQKTRNKKGEKQGQSKTGSNLTIHVKAGQLPLPVGLTSMLDFYSKSISPVDASQLKKNDESKKSGDDLEKLIEN